MSLVHLVDVFVLQRALASGLLAMATMAQSSADPLIVASTSSNSSASDSRSLDPGDMNTSETDLPFGELESVAQLNRSDSHCQEWQPTQHILFHTANLCYAVAFLIPHNFKLSMWMMRTVLFGGFSMFTVWAGVFICAPDIFAWNFTFMFICLIHVIYLSYKHFPPRMKPEYADLYDKVFKPLQMDKQHFTELVRDAEIFVLEEGAHYATEDVTAADERLSILLNGKLKVTCEDTHLHYIMQNEFLDSPEWEACPTDSDQLFQVTITAVEPSQYICWQRRRLHATLRNKPFLDSVIYNLVGKDITQKLYSLNEHMNPFGRSRQNQTNPGWHWKHHFPRSLSVDMVHTGTKGHVQSHLWRMQSRRNSSANSDSLASMRNPIGSKHKVHFPESRVSHAVFLTAGWISESFRRMTPSESYAERIPLWGRVSNRNVSVQYDKASDSK